MSKPPPLPLRTVPASGYWGPPDEEALRLRRLLKDATGQDPWSPAKQKSEDLTPNIYEGKWLW